MEAERKINGPTIPQMIAEKDGGIGWMIFNRPERHNAVSFEMWQAIPDIVADFAADEAVRVIVLKGAGERSFVSGADISQFEKNRASADAIAVYNAATEQATQALNNVEKPTIAMIRGYCLGGGCSIALSCDFRIASDNSTFAIPAAKLSVGYGYSGIKKLMDLVGPSFTKEIFFTARQFTAEEAHAMGLVNRVLPQDKLEEYVREFAGTMAANAPLTLRAVKAAVAEGVKDSGKRDLERVQRLVEACFTSEDYKEGRTAFMEKRPPVFKGR